MKNPLLHDRLRQMEKQQVTSTIAQLEAIRKSMSTSNEDKVFVQDKIVGLQRYMREGDMASVRYLLSVARPMIEGTMAGHEPPLS